MIWDLWAKSSEGYSRNLTDHPSIIAIAKRLSAAPDFMRWVGFDAPAIVELDATCHIVTAALTRIKLLAGEFDTVPVKIGVPLEQADLLFKVPGLGQALWDSGWISSTAIDHFVLRAPDGAFPTPKQSLVAGAKKKWNERARKKAMAAELLDVERLISMNPLERNDVPRG